MDKSNIKIDLHIHSYYSDDGEFSPIKLIEKCKENKIRIMSITDNNCAGANEEDAKVAKENNIIYIPGIEIDCSLENKKFVTCGSDYHGKTKPSVKLGQTGCLIDESEMIENIKNNLACDN